MKKLLSMVLALMMALVAVSAVADTVETVNEDGSVTVVTDAGISFTYSKEDFEIAVGEDGSVNGKYVGETPEPVGFTIQIVTDTDAETYMNATAEVYGSEVTKDITFDDETEWVSTECAVQDGDYITIGVFYACDFEGGCYVVAVYSYFENTAADEETSDEDVDFEGSAALEMVLDSLTFAK